MDFGICVAAKQAGLQQIMILPSLETQYRVLEDFSRKVLEKM